MSLLVLVVLLPPFLSGLCDVVTFFYDSFDEMLLVAHVEISQTEHAAERKPSWARTTQAARYQSAIASGCSGDPSWRLRCFNETPI